MVRSRWVLTVGVALVWLLGATWAQQCGEQADGAVCEGGRCCSRWGWCGDTPEYCGEGCQSQCPTPPSQPSGPVTDIISEDMFNEMLLHRNDPLCPSSGFYTYDAFINAANSFPDFGASGDNDTRRREVAAFLAQTSHETAGMWDGAPDGPYAWGYCLVKDEGNGGDYCDPLNFEWPCIPGKKYYGRGPIQLKYNYNYGQAGDDLGWDLLGDPDLVETDAMVSFETALWFWMTPRDPKPSCHDVITGEWTPSWLDQAAGRVPGYGLTTNIINGGQECGFAFNPKASRNRIGFYERYCQMFGVSPGDNLDCSQQLPFDFGRPRPRSRSRPRFRSRSRSHSHSHSRLRSKSRDTI